MVYDKINDLVDEKSGIIIISVRMVEIFKISTNLYGSLFLGFKNMVGKL